MADGTMFSFRRFHIRQYFAYYKEENPKKCLLFNFYNEGAQSPESTQAIEGIQAFEDNESPETSEAKRRRKGKAVVEYKDPTAIRRETSVEYEVISDSETATDSEPEDPRGNETGVNIDQVIEHKTAVHYEIISDSETATVPKGNETGVETDKEIVLMDLDSDRESDDKSWDSLRKRKAFSNKKKKALQAKKLRFNDAETSNRELAGLHAELLNDFDKALNLDEEMSVAKRKGSGSRSMPGCCGPSGSGFVTDRNGGEKKQQELKAKVPRRLVMTKPLSRILEGLKSEFTNQNLPMAPLFLKERVWLRIKGLSQVPGLWWVNLMGRSSERHLR